MVKFQSFGVEGAFPEIFQIFKVFSLDILKSFEGFFGDFGVGFAVGVCLVFVVLVCCGEFLFDDIQCCVFGYCEVEDIG